MSGKTEKTIDLELIINISGADFLKKKASNYLYAQRLSFRCLFKKISMHLKKQHPDCRGVFNRLINLSTKIILLFQRLYKR